MPRKSASRATAAIPADIHVPPDFGARVVNWQRVHGRHDLPWQNTRDAYRIWLSEIMLQQTQVSAVIEYFQRFVATLPTVQALAAAPADQVMALWAGLGYYSRARNLHRCAMQVVSEHGGVFPTDPTVLATLPGIGRSTAAAIAAFSAGVRSPILDGNVKRVFARCFGIHGHPGERAVETRMWQLAGIALPAAGPRQAEDMVAYTQGLMDLGATVCSRGKPACLADAGACPLSADCVARRDGLTGVLPTPKPRAAIPERSTVMLMVRREREVLLRLRPGSGIWGGLWSLPEMPVETLPFDAEAAEAAAFDYARAYGAPVRAAIAGELTHVFTHFRLLIRAIRVDVGAGDPMVQDGATEATQRWLSLDDLDALGTPAPVRRLLEDQARGGLF
ncbi:A/G-specific adenine glycosylase [Cupriavidus sp. AcVe19-1a]|uniref:A/G-specific adenine glycosylase n=1 Tax=Cupriavidus sp. AcVe19-1a TaxID=2821359 RepID=UPI001AE90E2E|nr:A/G-specific adenine glycosylase [Cupriavidus sp. AcVe19-1a]MBP0627333.1 A/G-specific adenine glycosylase [Cupriavidus sp. AcVe19-1a]